VHKTEPSPSDTLATFNRRLMIRGMPGPYHLCADGCRSLELAGITLELSEGTS
jgi:hypothetical protein